MTRVTAGSLQSLLNHTNTDAPRRTVDEHTGAPDSTPGLDAASFLCSEWQGVAYEADGSLACPSVNRDDGCTLLLSSSLTPAHAGGATLTQPSAHLRLERDGGVVMEGEARLRPGPQPSPTEDAASACWVFRLDTADGAQHDGTLSVSTNGRALTLSTRGSHAASAATRDHDAGHASAAVYRLMRVDRSFDERSRPCTPAEAVGELSYASTSGRRSSSGQLAGSSGHLTAAAVCDLGDNRVVQTLWLGDELSALEYLSAASFLAHGHQVHLYTYNPELRNVPDGVVLKNASSIMADDTQHRPYKFVQTFADLFRYKMLYEHGGWWVDLDLVLLRPLTHANAYCFATELERGTPKVTNCALKCPARCPLLEYCIAQCQQRHDLAQASWLEIGPVLLHRAVHHFRLQQHTVPFHAFCPLPYAGFLNRFVFPHNCTWPAAADTHHQAAYAIHCYNSLWSFAKDRRFHQDTLFEELKRRYRVARSIGPCEAVDAKTRMLLNMAHLQSMGKLDLAALMAARKQPANS